MAGYVVCWLFIAVLGRARGDLEGAREANSAACVSVRSGGKTTRRRGSNFEGRSAIQSSSRELYSTTVHGRC